MTNDVPVLSLVYYIFHFNVIAFGLNKKKKMFLPDQLFWLYLVKAIFGITSHILNNFVWLRITVEGSVPEMRIIIVDIINLIRFKIMYTS